MKQDYNTQPTDDDHLFEAADKQYAMMKETLASRAFGDDFEAQVERWLRTEQQELMRRLLQSHLTLRGEAQAVRAVVGADEVERTHMRPSKSRNLETTFGTVEVERTAHAGRGVEALHPVDARLNLPGEKYSHEVERQVAKFAARLSFDATLKTMRDHTASHVPKRQAELLVQRAARDFEVFYAETGFTVGTATSELLVMTYDQKGVVMLPTDLTKATQKAAQNSRKKLETRGSKGEPRRGRKRMAMVAGVYTVAPYVRTADEIIAGLRRVRDATPRKRPRPEYKRVWASLQRPARLVITDAFDEAEKRDPEHTKRWLVVVDGDSKLERWVRAEARRRGVEITLVLDFIHALEYLWRAGHAFFDEGSSELEAWVLERLQWMLEGKISSVVAAMTRKATVQGLDAKTRKPVDTAARYLLKRKEMMRYEDLLSLGAPIASGIIEGACRHLINDRLDLTGARWRLPCAEAILRLRSLLSSDDFDEYWRFHEEQDQRKHALRYANGEVPEVRRPGKRGRLRLAAGVD